MRCILHDFTSSCACRQLAARLTLVMSLWIVLLANVEAQTVVAPTAQDRAEPADDTPALQNALDRGPVKFSPGTYRITRPLVIDLDKNGFSSLIGDGTARIVMAGAGPAIRFVGTHKGTADPESVQPQVWAKQRMPTISHLEIVGDHAEADGIEASGTMQLMVSDLLIRKVRHGIHLVGRNRNVIIHDCQIYENHGIGIYYDHVDLHQSNIIGCHVSYNHGGGIVSRGGAVRNLHIGTCDIEANMAVGKPPAANVWIDCSEGSTAEVTITGCTLQHGAEAPGSANLVYIGGAPVPVDKGNGAAVPSSEPTRWGHLTVTGNVFTDTRVNVHLKHVRGATITGNSFGQGLEHNLLIQHSSALSIGLNTFDRNPRYYQSKLAAPSRDAIEIENSTACTFQGCTIVGGRNPRGAVVFLNCESMNVSGCTILDSDGPGVLVKNCRGTLISGCIINDRRVDAARRPMIDVEGGSGNQQSGNLSSAANEKH